MATGDLHDWPRIRPSQWTAEQRAHVWRLVHGGCGSTEGSPSDTAPSDPPAEPARRTVVAERIDHHLGSQRHLEGTAMQTEECGFCTNGVLTFRGRSQSCPYCGGSGQMHVVGLPTIEPGHDGLRLTKGTRKMKDEADNAACQRCGHGIRGEHGEIGDEGWWCSACDKPCNPNRQIGQ